MAQIGEAIGSVGPSASAIVRRMKGRIAGASRAQKVYARRLAVGLRATRLQLQGLSLYAMAKKLKENPKQVEISMALWVEDEGQPLLWDVRGNLLGTIVRLDLRNIQLRRKKQRKL